MKKMKVLGMGWPKCNQLEERAKDAVKQLGIEAKWIR